MTWFYVDDNFSTHPKCIGISMEAVGVWTMAGTWCARHLTDGYIRLVVSRGFGDLGLSPKNCPTPSIVCIADTIKLYPEELYATGMRIVTAPTRRVSPAALPPMIKSLNYLNNIMAKIEAINSGVLECIMLNPQGQVAEASGDNIFAIQDEISAAVVDALKIELLGDVPKAKVVNPEAYALVLKAPAQHLCLDVGRRRHRLEQDVEQRLEVLAVWHAAIFWLIQRRATGASRCVNDWEVEH